MSDKELIKELIKNLKAKVDDESSYSIGWKQALRAIEISIDSLPEEHNEDLDDATHKYSREWYAKRIGVHPKCKGCHAHIKDAFKAGAEWQKQQIMKDAIKGTVCHRHGNVGDIYFQSDSVLSAKYPFRYGERIKIIIVKEDML